MLLTTAVNSTEIKAMKTFARMYLCQLKVNTTYERCNEAIEDHKNTAPCQCSCVHIVICKSASTICMEFRNYTER